MKPSRSLQQRRRHGWLVINQFRRAPRPNLLDTTVEMGTLHDRCTEQKQTGGTAARKLGGPVFPRSRSHFGLFSFRDSLSRTHRGLLLLRGRERTRGTWKSSHCKVCVSLAITHNSLLSVFHPYKPPCCAEMERFWHTFTRSTIIRSKCNVRRPFLCCSCRLKATIRPTIWFPRSSRLVYD